MRTDFPIPASISLRLAGRMTTSPFDGNTKSTLSPGFRRSRSRTFFGMVIWPFDVIVGFSATE